MIALLRKLWSWVMTIFTGTLTATDGSGQSAQATVSVNQVPKLTVAANVTPASGPPGTTFRIDTQITGGVPPYSYICQPINGVQPQPVAGSPGSFTVTI